MSMRIVKSARRTDETEISLTLNLDGSGIYDVDTGCGFLNHMLELFSRHGRFDLTLACRGDVQVDYHHTVEDIAIVLGRAFSEALGDRAGINRYGTCTLPMDEALILAAVDISGRPAVGYALEVPPKRWAISTPNWWRNSCWASRAAWAARCMCAAWRAQTATISSRACLRRWPAR